MARLIHNFNDILDFWTLERIKGAVPVEDIVVPLDDAKKLDLFTTELEITHSRRCREDSEIFSSVSALLGIFITWLNKYLEETLGLGPVMLTRFLVIGLILALLQVAGSATKKSVPSRPLTKRARRVKVGDEDIRKSPYASVGRIYAAPKNKFDKAVYATAFYIGQSTELDDGFEVHRLLTVAHALDCDKFNTKYHIFVPSSNQDLTNRDEIYLIKGMLPHPKYRSAKSGERTYHYDLCVAFVIPHQYRSEKTMSIGEKLTPLKLVVHNGNLNTNNVIEVIGFPVPRYGPSFGKMAKVVGSFIHSHTISNYHPLTIQIHNFVPYGMSGGPWLLGNKVCGIQSAFVFQPNGQANAVSPIFREELLNKLDLEYESLVFS